MGGSLKKSVKIVAILVLAVVVNAVEKVEEKQEERLGLLASTLGVAPVPGYTPEHGHGQGHGEGQGGGLALVSGGGNYETESVPMIGGGGLPPYKSSGFQGGNSAGPCQCVPVEHCATSGGPPAPPPGPYPGGDKQPVIVEPPHEKQPESGYGPVGGGGGDGDLIGSNPPKDGAGVIDIRIVNRPPGAGGVQCSPGQVFCCGANNIGNIGGGSGIGGGNHFPGGGYSGCGERNILDVPGWVPEYGQAKFGAYPSMAVILGKGNNYIGAGALLNANYVLTVAHKVQSWKPGTYMKVRLGEWNAKDDDEPYKNIEIEVENVDIHPQFNPENLFNDVALIRLAKPIDINAFPHIRSACLPKQQHYYKPGQRCWVAGFGKDAFGNGKHSYIMKEVDLPIVESNTCENLLRGTRLGKYFELNKYSFICAGGEEGKDACTGDGGSPLLCENNGVWNVVGLVAWGIGCADYAVPGVYVNVQNFQPWIETKISY